MSTAEQQDPWSWPNETWQRIVQHVRAGRSLKPKRWKDGATFAVALSFDSDHETIELRYGGKSYSKISQGQYGARAAMPRILAILERHNVKASFFMPAVAAMLHEGEVKAVAEAGHEVGIHSWIHEFNSTLGYETERDLMFRASDVLTKLAGKRPVGMRTASWDFSPWTLKIVRELGLLYDSSLMADDECYELLDESEPTGIVELPVEWIRDDAVYYNMDRATTLRPYGGPSMVFDIFTRELDAAAKEGGLFQLTMHPHVSGHRSRVWMIDEIIAAAKAKGGAWFATHEEIAAYCAKEAGLKPVPK